MISVQELVKLLEEEDAAMMGLREVYTITLTRPPGVSINAMKRYIAEAVRGWKGGFEPPNEQNGWTGNPLFNLDVNIVVRRKANEEKRDIFIPSEGETCDPEPVKAEHTDV